MVEDWWSSITFDIADFLREISIKNLANGTSKIHYVDSSKNNNTEAIIVDEVSSSLGRCYIIKSDIKLEVNY